jgi:maltooligosyltrehalose trehalohydrolase
MPQRLMPFGAETDELGAICFRLWALAARIGSQSARTIADDALADGWFELPLVDVGAGARYRFAIDGGPQVPDQASRAQSENVHGASELQPSCLPILALSR